MGARPHPGSGSGRIAFDGSTDDKLIEIKDANKSFGLNAAYLLRLWTTAVKQGKRPIMVIKFTNNIIAEVRITRRGKSD